MQLINAVGIYLGLQVNSWFLVRFMKKKSKGYNQNDNNYYDNNYYNNDDDDDNGNELVKTIIGVSVIFALYRFF
jgi:hypothetical protein